MFSFLGLNVCLSDILFLGLIMLFKSLMFCIFKVCLSFVVVRCSNSSLMLYFEGHNFWFSIFEVCGGVKVFVFLIMEIHKTKKVNIIWICFNSWI